MKQVASSMNNPCIWLSIGHCTTATNNSKDKAATTANDCNDGQDEHQKTHPQNCQSCIRLFTTFFSDFLIFR